MESFRFHLNFRFLQLLFCAPFEDSCDFFSQTFHFSHIFLIKSSRITPFSHFHLLNLADFYLDSHFKVFCAIWRLHMLKEAIDYIWIIIKFVPCLLVFLLSQSGNTVTVDIFIWIVRITSVDYNIVEHKKYAILIYWTLQYKIVCNVITNKDTKNCKHFWICTKLMSYRSFVNKAETTHK